MTVGLAVATALLLGACDDFLQPDRSGEIRVSVGGDVSRPLMIITSSEFLVGGLGQGPEDEVQFVQSDTTLTPPPFERTYELSPTNLFAIRVLMPAGEAGDVRLQVHLDGRKVWDEQSSLVEGRVMQFYMVRR